MIPHDWTFTPVAPGWVAIPVMTENPNEWYHIVGWVGPYQPVINSQTGTHMWRDVFGNDGYCIATLDEWGKPEKCNT